MAKVSKLRLIFMLLFFSPKIWLVRILILFMQSNFLPLSEKFWQSVLVNDNQLCELGMYMPRRLIRCYDKSFSWSIPASQLISPSVFHHFTLHFKVQRVWIIIFWYFFLDIMKSCVSGFVFVFRCFWMDYYQCLIFGQFSRPDI